MPCRPFISYAKEDAEVAERLYNDLKRFGADPWLDSHALRGGESWKEAIREALRESTHVLTLISERSVTKTGFVQNEVRQALDLLDSAPPGKIFVVPIRLDDSTPRHEKLKDLHGIDLFPDYVEGVQRVADSLDLNPSGGVERRNGFLRQHRFAAGALVFFILGFGFQYASRVRAEPDVISDSRVLYPDGQRGSSAAIGVTIPARASVLLTFSALRSADEFTAYRVDLVDIGAEPPRQIWSRTGVSISGDGLFAITIPNEYLREGLYRLSLFGVSGSSAEPLASYTVRATNQ